MLSLEPEAYARTGVIMANERVKFRLMHGDIPVNWVGSIYLQRDPMTDDENNSVLTVKGERDAAKDKREKDDAEKLAREKRAMFALGKESAQGAPPDLAQVVATAKSLAALGLKF